MIVAVKNIPFLADALRTHDEVLSVPHTEITNELLRQHRCTALFIRTTTKVNEQLLDGTAVQFVGTATSGVDHLDLHYLERQGITYYNAAGSNANAVAEYALYCLLQWSLTKQRDLTSLKVGVVGYGFIGKRIANYAHLLGMKVLVNDPPLEDAVEPLPLHFGGFRELNELLTSCDVMSNHIPLNETGPYATRNLFSGSALSLMRDSSLFIHSSRGGILDESSIASAMDEKKISLCIDVWSEEPEYDIHIARLADVATPHVSGHSDDGIIDAASKLLYVYERYSGNEYDASIISQHKSTAPRRIQDYTSVNDLTQALKNALGLEKITSALREHSENTRESRMKLFQQLRSSYVGRREILKPSM